MIEKENRRFKNGVVYALETDDGYPVEVTDTFLPFYTKDAIGRGQNRLANHEVGSRKERWMIGVSCMSGCPVGCKFCATGQLKRCINLMSIEIFDQIDFVLKNNPHYDPEDTQEFKINYTRMGEPFFNLEAIRDVIHEMDIRYKNVHHYISTIGIKGSDFSWIKDNVTLQISLHSLDEERRRELIPIKNLMSLEELGQIRTDSKLKTTLNLTLVDEKDFDIERLKELFDPEYFFVKLSPINPNDVSDGNELGLGIVKSVNLV